MADVLTLDSAKIEECISSIFKCTSVDVLTQVEYVAQFCREGDTSSNNFDRQFSQDGLRFQNLYNNFSELTHKNYVQELKTLQELDAYINRYDTQAVTEHNLEVNMNKITLPSA